MTSRARGHVRLYRSLLRLYPADYRERYSDQMVQLFGDQLRADGGRAWLAAPLDVITTAASEHLRRNRTVAHSMTLAPTPAGRLFGLMGVLGGGILLVGFLPLFIPDFPISADNFNLRLVLFNIGAMAIAAGVYRRQSPAGRRLALAGSIPAIIANALYLVFTLKAVAQPGDVGPGAFQPVDLFNLTAAFMWLADGWLGVVTFRLGVMNRLPALALTVGSISAFVGMGIFGLVEKGTPLEFVVLSGIALHGLAWILLGLELGLRRRPAPTATA